MAGTTQGGSQLRPPLAPLACRENYYPGDIGFDPLGLKPASAEEFVAIQQRELSNGRLAMLAGTRSCADIAPLPNSPHAHLHMLVRSSHGFHGARTGERQGDY